MNDIFEDNNFPGALDIPIGEDFSAWEDPNLPMQDKSGQPQCIDVDDPQQYNQQNQFDQQMIENQNHYKQHNASDGRGFYTGAQLSIPEHEISSQGPAINETGFQGQIAARQNGRSSLDSCVSMVGNQNSTGDARAFGQQYTALPFMQFGNPSMAGVIPNQGFAMGFQPFQNMGLLHQQFDHFMNYANAATHRRSEDSAMSNAPYWQANAFNMQGADLHQMKAQQIPLRQDCGSQGGASPATGVFRSALFSSSGEITPPNQPTSAGVAPQPSVPKSNSTGPDAQAVKQDGSEGDQDVNMGLQNTVRQSFDSSLPGGSLAGMSRRSMDKRTSLDSASGRGGSRFKQTAAQKEKQRRDKFSHLIARLRDLVPPSSTTFPATHSNQYCTDQRPKNAVLMDAIHFIEKLQGSKGVAKSTSEGGLSDNQLSGPGSVQSQPQAPERSMKCHTKLASPSTSTDPPSPPTTHSLTIARGRGNKLHVTLVCATKPQLLARVTHAVDSLGLNVLKCEVAVGSKGTSQLDCIVGGLTELDEAQERLKAALRDLVQS